MAATIYFSGSISSGRADVEIYRRIVAALEAAGHAVLAGAVTAGHVGPGGEALPPARIFERDLAWVAEADLLVADVSLPSTGVGYEVAAARYRYRIPVICLWRPGHTLRCSAMISGDAGIELIEYAEEAFEGMLERLLAAVARTRRAEAVPPAGGE